MVCICLALYSAHICLLSLLLHTIAGTLAVESIHLFISLLVKKNNFNVTVSAVVASRHYKLPVQYRTP